MKTLLLIVDDETSKAYEDLAPEIKQQFANEVSQALKKVAWNARCSKLNQLIKDINDGVDRSGINSELIHKLLPVD